MCDRSFGRPRDIILFVNGCLDLVEGKSSIPASTIKEAEAEYSRQRLRSLGDEWSGDFPHFLQATQLLNGRPGSFKVRDIASSELDNFILNVCTDLPSDSLLYKLATELTDGKRTYNSFVAYFVKMFYRTGTHASKLAFVSGWLSDLLAQPGFNLGRANLQKFLMRNLLESRIRELRMGAVKQAYQESLFGDAAFERVSVSTAFVYDFRPEVYAPSRDYDGQFGQHRFRKHFYSRIGDFDSKEEFECAVWLDTQAQKGRLQYWVRNLARREGASFFFQKATGFYPDFVCKLNDDSFLIVEYKGANGWTDAQDDRDIGGLWAKLSNGTCQFVMVKEKQWSGVDVFLPASTLSIST